MGNWFDAGQVYSGPIYELSPEDSQHFYGAVRQGMLDNKYGACVTLRQPDGYAGLRLFVIDGGGAGFALDGWDIVSAFKGNTKAPNIAHAMLQLAVQEGGRTLDCFDTVLPYLYSPSGFRAVSRVQWDEKQAPGQKETDPVKWDKELYKKYNNGEPDIVIMAYDHNYDDLYKRGAGEQFGSDGDAAWGLQATKVQEFSETTPSLKPRFEIEGDTPNERVSTYMSTKVAPVGTKPSFMERLKAYTDYDHLKSTVFPSLLATWQTFHQQTFAEHAPVERVGTAAQRAPILGIPRKIGDILHWTLGAFRGNQSTANHALVGGKDSGVWLPVMRAGEETKQTLALREELEAMNTQLEELEEGSKEATKLLNQIRRKGAKLDSLLAREFTTGEIEKVSDSLNTVLEPLKELAKERGVDPQVVIDHLFKAKMVAERDLELAGQLGERAKLIDKGVDAEAANEILADLREMYGADGYKALDDVGKAVRKWSDAAIVEPLVRSGRLAPDVAAKIRRSNQFYIPFFRVMDEMEEKGFVSSGTSVFEVRSIPIHEIKGSERKIVDPLSMLVKLAFNTADAAARGHVAMALAESPEFADISADIRVVPWKFYPVPVTLRQEIDPPLRQALERVAAILNTKITVKERVAGRRNALGRYMQQVRAEAAAGAIDAEQLRNIEIMFGTTEKTLAHEIGHLIDAFYARTGSKGALIDALMATPQMKRELREVSDRRLGDFSSQTFRKYVRSLPEQVAEFVATYLADRYTAINYAPHVVEAFEAFARAHPEIAPLTNIRNSGQVGVKDFNTKAWTRSMAPPEPNTLLFHKAGKAYWLHVPPDIYRAVTGMTRADSNLLVNILRAPSQWLKMGAVYNPEFMTRNPLRDVMMAWVFSRHGFQFHEWAKDFYKLLTNNEDAQKIYAKFAAGGGGFADLASTFVETQAITREKILGKKKGVVYCAHPLEALREVSSFVESVTRYSIYRQAIANGATHAQAIVSARTDTLDFHRMGGHPVIRTINMLVPFFNVSLQGAEKAAKEIFSGDPGRSKKVLFRIAVGITLPSLMLAAMFGDDDRVKELESWERNLFWHIPIPGGPLLRIPKPFELGIAFGSMFERMFDYARDGEVKGLKNALGQAFNAITPPVMPAFLRPFLEQSSNFNFFMNREIEDAGLRNLPVELRYKPWTSEAAKWFSQGVGKYVGISPVMFEHHIRSSFGGLGSGYLLPAIDFAMRKTGVATDIPKADQPFYHSIPFIRALFSRDPSGMRSKTSNDFFEDHVKSLQADQGWKALMERGQPQAAYEMLKESPEAIYARAIRKTLAELGKIRKERDKITASPTIDSAAKRVYMDKFDDRVEALVGIQKAMMAPGIMEKAVAVVLPEMKKIKANDKEAVKRFYEFADAPIERSRVRVTQEWDTIKKMTQSQRDAKILAIIRQEQRGGSDG